MTVCAGPSITSIVFTLIIAVLVPSLIIYLVHKRWKPTSKSLFVLFSAVTFILLFFAIFFVLYQAFTPPCGPGIACIPFEFYPENNTCKSGDKLITNAELCNKIQERYLAQLESDKKYCPEGNMASFF